MSLPCDSYQETSITLYSYYDALCDEPSGCCFSKTSVTKSFLFCTCARRTETKTPKITKTIEFL